jgi:AcrR family transcriptional regulator
MEQRYQRCVDAVNVVSKLSTRRKLAIVTTSATSQTSLSRGRRSARPSGDDRELAILATAERLLEDRPLTDISVDDLAKGAGISRPTFYFYFPSKEAVLLTLLDRVVNEADTALEALIEEPDADRDNMWRTGINVFFETFGSHKAVTRAGQAARNTSAEVAELWSTFMQKWIAYAAAGIDAERERGVAPVTLPAQELATALNLMNERTLSASFLAEEPSVPEARVVDTLVHIWVSSIYGEAR